MNIAVFIIGAALAFAVAARLIRWVFISLRSGVADVRTKQIYKRRKSPFAYWTAILVNVLGASLLVYFSVMNLLRAFP